MSTYCQAEHTQNEINDDRLGLAIVPAEPPEQLSIVLSFPSIATHYWGLVPIP